MPSKKTATTAPASSRPLKLEENLYHYRAIVVRVKDGDTVVLNIDLGLGLWKMDVSVRLYGVNTPESFGTAACEAGRLAKEWTIAKLPVGAKTLIKTKRSSGVKDLDKSDVYGRLLADVWLGGEEISISEQLIAAGHAQPFMVEP